MITILIDEFGQSIVYSANFGDILNKVSSETENFIVYNIAMDEYLKINNVNLLSEKGTVILFQKEGKKVLNIAGINDDISGKNLLCLSSDKFNEEFNRLDERKCLKLYTSISKDELNNYVINQQIDNCTNSLLFSSLDDIIDYDYELLEKLTKINSKTLKKSRH